jgi:CRISPR/Cas system CSM-associated protein Csm3 (group 7 of RAMP superfamily)
MGRLVAVRYELRGTLRVASALHVGSGEGELGVDLAPARDGAGRLHVPGTSLAGVLRAWTASVLGEAEVRRLWGWKPDREEKEAEGWASRILVEDAPVELPPDADLEIRDGVGIDRNTGAAARHIKYERLVLPVGSEIRFVVGCAAEAAEEALAHELLQALRLALRQRGVRLGAGRSRGLGRLELASGSDVLTRERLDGRDAVLAALRRRVAGGGEPPETLPAPEGVAAAGRSTTIRVALTWAPAGPLMVRAGTEGLGVDSLPLTARVDGGRALVLPGSSIKGVLRSHAERVVRTVLDQREPRPDFEDQLRPHELVEWLFGSAPRRGAEAPASGDELRIGLGAVHVEDCLSADRVPAAAWKEIEESPWIGEADKGRHQRDDPARSALAGVIPVRQALDRLGSLASWDPATHVAIDRWTGGAAEGRLYSVLEPCGVSWAPIELTLHLGRVRQDQWAAAVALLLVVLDDLACGGLPLGFATNRGMGDVRVSRVEFDVVAGTGDAGGERFGWLAGARDADERMGVLGSLDAGRLAGLREEWREWIQNNK